MRQANAEDIYQGRSVGYLQEKMLAYRATVDVQRKEIEKLRAELTNIANAKPHEWGEESDQFQAWAQNRALHALNPPDSGPAVHAEKLS